MVRVNLIETKNVIKETLTRIGIANKKERILYPSCYLYEKDDLFYIVHFKQLFLLTRNNGYNNVSIEDIARRNSVIYCLKTWGLIDVDDKEIMPHDKFVFVLSHKDKPYWKINHKFNISILDDIMGGVV